MLRSAQVWRSADDAQWSGLFTGRVPAEVAYQHAVERRDRIVHGRDDSLNAAAVAKAGATLVRGRGRIVKPGVLDVAGEEIGYRQLVINTGSTPARPPIPGLDSVPVWTSDEALSTSAYPRAVVVVGGGPVGCELAFLFATFGTAVTLVQRDVRLIPHEEPEASAALLDVLKERGVDVRLDAQVTRAEPRESGARVFVNTGDPVETDRVLLAVGRRPRSTALGLESLGVTLPPSGKVAVDDHCRVVDTENVWAIGDVTGIAPFTHTAHYQGRVVAANLSGRDVRADYQSILRAVYTDPVLASVGHTVASATVAGIEPMVSRATMNQTVRAGIEGATAGWVMLLADPRTRALIGATAIGGRAEEWISEISLAIRVGITVDVVADVVHPFPTFSEILEIPLWVLAGS